jgi:hypothetical protein
MDKIRTATTALIVTVLFVSAIAGIVFYYNGVLNDKNSKIDSLNNEITNQNNEIANLTSQISNLTSQVTNLTTSANLKTALNVTDEQAYTTDVIGVVDSNYPFHNMYISGSVTNIGKAIAFNAGLHVVAYDNSALEVDMTVPLGDGLAFGTDSATNAFLANNLTYGISSLKLSSLDNGQTMTINISIYHEGNVSNWTITPVWTNSP